MKLMQQQGRGSPCSPCSRGSSNNRVVCRPLPRLQQQVRLVHLLMCAWHTDIIARLCYGYLFFHPCLRQLRLLLAAQALCLYPLCHIPFGYVSRILAEAQLNISNHHRLCLPSTLFLTSLHAQAHMQHISSHSRPQLPAAAAADLTASVLPYISARTPKLQSRRMQGSPMDGLWRSASAALLQLELAAAATVDRHARYGPAVASVLAGVVAGMVRY
jgi:hypothetical protein